MSIIIPTNAASRTIVLPLILAFGQVLRFPTGKDPGDTLDFSIDLTNIVSETNDSLSSFGVAPTTEATSPALEIQAQDISGNVCTALISAGAPGTDYGLQFDFVLKSGLIISRTAWLLCNTLTTPHHNLQGV
jgi:hypothetical protein